MKKNLLIGLSLFLVLVVFIVARTPAQIPFLLCDQRTVLCAASSSYGTLWNARHVGVELVSNGVGYRLEAFEWQIDVLSTLMFRPKAVVRIRDNASQMSGELAWDGKALAIDYLQWEHMLRLPLLQGTTIGELKGVVVDEQGLSGIERGRVSLFDANVDLNRSRVEIGQLSMDLRFEEGEIVATPDSTNSVLGIEGECRVRGDQYRCALLVDASLINNDELHNTLNMLATGRVVNQTYPLEVEGRF